MHYKARNSGQGHQNEARPSTSEPVPHVSHDHTEEAFLVQRLGDQGNVPLVYLHPPLHAVLIVTLRVLLFLGRLVPFEGRNVTVLNVRHGWE